MFTCCVCNKSSKKSRKDSRVESESSSESTVQSAENQPSNLPKNGLKSPEKINGDAKTIENEISLPNSPRENSENREKSDATSDPESRKKRDENDDLKKTSLATSIEENSSLKSETPELSVREVPVAEAAEDSQNCEETSVTNPALQEIVSSPKYGCLHGPAYIERTIIDGTDDDGDDSVFEAPTGNNEPEVNGVQAPAAKPLPRWLSQEEENDKPSEGCDGMQEPPATPVARDELALRRHRFFSDLMQAARNTAEHRVSFDPLGPVVHSGCETDEREEHLEELVTRLENVTRRLESVPTKSVTQTQETAVQTKTPSPKRSDRVNGAPNEPSSPVETSRAPERLETMSVAGYEDLVAGPVTDYLQTCKKIGGDVECHGKLVQQAFQLQLQFIKTAASRPEPSDANEKNDLIKPSSKVIEEIQAYRETKRDSQFFNHLSAISESIMALGWVTIERTPAAWVDAMHDCGQFYTDRVRKEWKEKDQNHVKWCAAWGQTLCDLRDYIRKHHTTGLVWAKSGMPPPPPGGMPPPPPLMPIGDVCPAENLGDDRSALFAQINQGENITRSLKKVTSDMQTHKNSSLRTGPAPFKAPVANNAPVKIVPSANAPIDKPPVFSRDGKKWIVEYHKGNKDLLVEEAEMNNVVYMFRCQDSTLTVKGKINSIIIDSCRKSSVVFDSLVSSIEFVNCQSVQMQVLGKVPTISIDKTDGCQMYLSPDSMDVALISSKSSEMNVMVPKGNGDYTEYPVPEQFRTTINHSGLTTTAVDSMG